MKAKPEYVEGPEAAKRFHAAMRKVIVVPHAEIQRRVEAENKERAEHPRKRGRPRKP
jgi:hypothetical protein